MVAHLLHRLHHFLGSRFNAETVGVIVPYRSQISAIRNALQQYPSSLPPITIDTVERYQGSQRDVIIYSFTATHPDQLEFLTSGSFLDGTHTIDRRLNVVMTRARKQLLLVGDPTLLSQNPIYRQLISLYGIKATIQLSHV
jgi:superfamily I DNA and/or RNA helicase